jgi:hypothetical protein
LSYPAFPQAKQGFPTLLSAALLAEEGRFGRMERLRRSNKLSDYAAIHGSASLPESCEAIDVRRLAIANRRCAMEIILAGGVLALLGIGVAIKVVTSCNGGDGSICKDGWFSRSSGRGTCSWHGGVDSE